MKPPIGYCFSRYRTVRRPTRVVPVGDVMVGGNHPIVVQSMTTTPTQDIEATVRQARALAEAGCEVVRITAQNVKAAEALGPIRKRLREDGIHVPLVADIHFLPAAAMEAVKHVEKVRVNPGNYADKKKFAVLEYSDSEYDAELQRLYEAFTPLVLRAKELGRTLRIGTNHGSLSDRIMNRYGDSPEGMVESALEFVRIAESHGFHHLILSLKASNPKVMIAAYRLAAARMAEEKMDYPLHLGVTEAGDGEDGRIKSAVGIGSLLADGLGDTIRVSLTEDPVYEIPVARALADKAMRLWQEESDERSFPQVPEDSVDPFSFERREAIPVQLREELEVGGNQPPAVWLSWRGEDMCTPDWMALGRFRDTPLEGLIFPWTGEEALATVTRFRDSLPGEHRKAILVGELPVGENPPEEPVVGVDTVIVLPELGTSARPVFWKRLQHLLGSGTKVVLDVSGDWVRDHALPLGRLETSNRLIFTLSRPVSGFHAAGALRDLAEALHAINIRVPLLLRNHPRLLEGGGEHFQDRLLEASLLAGPLLCDGLGDLISVETERLPLKALTLGYNLLQAARARISKTEFVACPSCGRTLFDLQSTTQRIREKTGHLKGVTIAVMGCIVNGPGEMADADFGYVGGAPRKVNLYVGKQCVEYHVPEEEADQRLIELIKSHGKWVDPEKSEALSV